MLDIGLGVGLKRSRALGTALGSSFNRNRLFRAAGPELRVSRFVPAHNGGSEHVVAGQIQLRTMRTTKTGGRVPCFCLFQYLVVSSVTSATVVVLVLILLIVPLVHLFVYLFPERELVACTRYKRTIFASRCCVTPPPSALTT